MRFYILLPDDDFESLRSPNSLLGEISFKSFYAENGFRALRNMIERYPDVLEDVSIIDDNMKKYSVSQFLDLIAPLKLMIND